MIDSSYIESFVVVLCSSGPQQYVYALRHLLITVGFGFLPMLIPAHHLSEGTGRVGDVAGR